MICTKNTQFVYICVNTINLVGLDHKNSSSKYNKLDELKLGAEELKLGAEELKLGG